MRNPLLKKHWVFALTALASFTLPASPLTAPARLVTGQKINLLPLFQWWTNHAGPRPLPAWVHVTGSVAGTNAAGWVLQGQVEHTGRSRTTGSEHAGSGKIILRNPPLQQRAEFEKLQTQLPALKDQRAKAAAQQSAAQSSAQALTQEQRAYHGRSRILAQEIRQAKAAEADAQAVIKTLDLQIQAIKKRLAVYPAADHYRLDCFALDTGQLYAGLPIYDHGLDLLAH